MALEEIPSPKPSGPKPPKKTDLRRGLTRPERRERPEAPDPTEDLLRPPHEDDLGPQVS